MKKTLVALMAGAALLASGSAMAEKVVVASQNAPAAIGPYSAAIAAGDTLYVSGMLPLTPKGEMVNTSIADATRQSMNNIKALLAANGMTMDNVVSTTLYVKDLSKFGEINKAYGEYFKDGKAPARVTIGVAALPKNAEIEIAAIAVK